MGEAAVETGTGAHGTGQGHPATLSVAIIGTGFMGGVHARSARLAGGQVSAVGASDPTRSRAAAARLSAQRVIDSPDQLAAAEGIDVVHVCTPNALHAPYAEAALCSGKHVVCEKPLATDTETAARLESLARQQGLVATVPFVYRFYPTVRHARASVLAGDLGRLRLLHGNYLQDWMSEPTDWSWRVDSRVNGPSRAFADIGSHWCDLVEFISGHRIKSLIAKLDTIIPERRRSEHSSSFTPGTASGPTHQVDTEDVGLLMFETDQGASGTAAISQVSPGRKNRLWIEIDGADAAIVFNQEHPDELWIGRRDANTSVPRGSDLMQADAERLSALPPGHPQGYRDCFDAFVADTYEAIRGEAPAGLPTFADGARAAQLVSSVLESAANSRWVEVPT